MESPIQAQIQDNLKILEAYVHRTPQQLHHKFLFITLYRLIQDEIEEETAFHILQTFITQSSCINQIPKLGSIIKLLLRKEFHNITRYLTLHIKKVKRETELCQVAKMYRNCAGGIFTHRFRILQLQSDQKTLTREQVDTLYQISEEFGEMVKCFDDRRFINFVRRPKLYETVSSEEWRWQHENELKNRMKQMVEQFGIQFLKLCQVPIVCHLEYQHFSFQEKIRYFSKCCIQLRVELNNLTNLMMKRTILHVEISTLEECYNFDPPSDLDSEDSSDFIINSEEWEETIEELTKKNSLDSEYDSTALRHV